MSVRPISNPPNPWRSGHVDWLGEPPAAKVEIYEDHSAGILSRNKSPDVPFTWSINPYRGCFHGCAYCYARPSHQYLDFGAGSDFERKLVVKRRAAALLRDAFDRPSWRGEVIAFSGNTDCYQPIEAAYGLTRACLAVCRDYSNPVGIITKSALVERDVALLKELSAVTTCRVIVSIPFADAEQARAIEPHVPTPRRRFQVLETLAAAGLEVGVMVAPIIPGLNDEQIPEILHRAREAGARFAGSILLRLPDEVEQVFSQRLTQALPLRAERVLSQIRDCRGGDLTDGRFGKRMRGQGARWQAIADLFQRTRDKLGFSEPAQSAQNTFRRPTPQLSLFG